MVEAKTLWFNKSRRARDANDDETWIEKGVSPTLNSFDLGDIRTNTAIANQSSVRRLTPIECERLQGFPDNWTERVSDSQRYKQMGNAVTVHVIAWIGERLSDDE